jgi:DNA excision repair protein ERCC-3
MGISISFRRSLGGVHLFRPENPLIVQSDRTLLLEIDNPLAEACRDRISIFCDLIKSPEHMHTYRISPLSLWNASAAGFSCAEMLQALHDFSKYDIPQNILADIRDYVARYGRLKMRKEDESLLLWADTPELMVELLHNEKIHRYFLRIIDDRTVAVAPLERGRIKQALVQIGFPVEDLAGYSEGAQLPIYMKLNHLSKSGAPFQIRDYQLQAAQTFWAGGSSAGGSGVIVMPCGAGKTVVGMQVMALVQMYVLIIATNISSARQWKEELLDKTTLREDQIGEYSGERKEIRPVTIATYQILTTRRNIPKPDSQDIFRTTLQKDEESYVHLNLFNKFPWGLIIYDEVHMLPAQVFRMTAEIQSRRRLGLTATLVREDGREEDVFSLIGPKRCDIPWKALEKQGWIAEASCVEMRVPMEEAMRLHYAIADQKNKYRISAENPRKLDVMRMLCEKHKEDCVLIIGQYLDQLHIVAQEFKAPLITGQTPQLERQELYNKFKNGEIRLLVVSRVANFSIDLPDANVAIQISGTFGSRQEEAQRLGRILRPKADGSGARFYTIVTRETRDQEFAIRRQLFLAEQGYRYEIINIE